MRQPALKPSKIAEQGFTLIEVMVALVIVAVALSAASRSLGVTASNQSHLEDRIVATWVAEDAVIEQQVLGAITSTAETSGFGSDNLATKSMLGRDWKIETASEPTLIPQVYKMSVKVYDPSSKEVAANLFTVVGKPE